MINNLSGHMKSKRYLSVFTLKNRLEKDLNVVHQKEWDGAMVLSESWKEFTAKNYPQSSHKYASL